MAKKKRNTRNARKKKPGRIKSTKKNYKIPKILYYTGLGIICLLLYMYIFDQKIDLNGDNASYYMLGKQLAQFKGFVNGYLIDATPHKQFPPGYPVMLTPFMWISDSISFIKSISGIFYIAGTLGLYTILNRLRPNRNLENFGISVLIACNYFMLKYATIMMSEEALVFVSIAAILFFINKEIQASGWMTKDLIVLALITSLAYHIKTLALPLFGAFVFHFLLKRQYKNIGIYCTTFILSLIPWMIRNRMVGAQGYIDDLIAINPYQKELGTLTFNDLIARIFVNIERYFSKEIPVSFFPLKQMGPTDSPPSFYMVAGILVIAIAIFGLIKLPNFKWFLFAYVGGTFGILMVWPEVWYGPRFMIGVLPIMLMLFYLGSTTIIDLLLKDQNKNLCVALKGFAFAIFGLLLFGSFSPKTTANHHIIGLHKYRSQPYPAAYKNFFELGKWSSKNLPEDQVVASRKAVMYYLYSDKSTIRYPYESDPDKFFNTMKEKGSKYIVVDQLGYSQTQKFVVSKIQQFPDRFRLIHKIDNPETYLFEVL